MNPFLPLTEYIPDGEAHVFENRVYLYGSHDKALSDRFCVEDYTVWSAPVDDLSKWENHGISYSKSQDPRSRNGKLVDYYAPDCVQGKDGRFYLYYVAMGPNTRNFGPISVAVSSHPAGPFEYLGDVKYPNGQPVLKFMNNDPAVLNDNGRIWLYYGWGLGRDFRNKLLAPLYNKVLSTIAVRSVKEVKATKPSILSCAVVELEADMLTVKSEPKAVLDSKTTALKDSLLYKHPFYEAPSIRKVGELYYLVYSSGENNELCYAVSSKPDCDFHYGGVIISNSDLGYKGNSRAKAPAGTIHGCIEYINGQWYVFYHRCTNNTDFSRQACVEKIEISMDGRINQVEVTSEGFSEHLEAKGTLNAAYCCNLIPQKPIKLGFGKQQTMPRITEEDGKLYVASVVNGTILGYKYLDFTFLRKIGLEYRGSGKGRVEVSISEKGSILGSFEVTPSVKWKRAFITGLDLTGVYPLYLKYKGTGKIDLKSLDFGEKSFGEKSFDGGKNE